MSVKIEGWFSLPQSLRNWWWKETDYGKKEASAKLRAIIEECGGKIIKSNDDRLDSGISKVSKTQADLALEPKEKAIKYLMEEQWKSSHIQNGQYKLGKGLK